MKLTRLLVFLFTVLAVISVTAHAQSINSENLKQVKVDELSDADIKAYYQKATATGLSEDQLYNMAVQRGMPEAEIAKLKLRVAALNLNPAKKNGIKSKETAEEDTVDKDAGDRKVNEDAMKVPMQKVSRDTTIFGTELFMASSMVFEPNLRIPSPGNYILGPDDQLSVNVYGYSEQVYNITVNAEGNVYIPNVGPIKVSGITIDEAADKIRNKLAATIYKAIRTGQTKVEVSLGRIRSIRVTIIGQATKPGTYTVSSLTSLFNMLYLCGGPNDMGSFRNIELIRGNKPLKVIDLYAFLLLGDRKDNVLLQEQDVIRIPYYNTRVVMEGAIKRPGKFELLPVESFEQLLSYSGGFADSAYRSSVQVTRISDMGIVLSDIASKEFAGFMPKTGDAFHISKNINRFSNRVTLKGAVLRPGDFELKPGMSLKQLLETAGGLRPDAFTERGLILRQNDDLTLSSKSFVVRDILSGKETVLLKREDVISISSILDLRDALTVDIEGAVRKPGTYAFSDSLTIKDLVLKGGGFSETANPTTVEISRRIKNPDIKQSDFRQTEVITIDLSKGLSSVGGETLMQPYDIVNVRSEPGYNNPRVVYVEGQVMNSGRYVLEASGERISNLLKRAGGFKGSADSSSITIRRLINPSLSVEERQSIVERMLNISRDSLESNSRLLENFLKDAELLGVNVQKIKDEPGGHEDLILESGDVITVARASNLVRVNGEVYNPTLLPFEDHTSARYYIRRSGNYTNNARRSGVFVIYPDGRAKSVKQFLFFRSYPPVTPRAEVYVPSKEASNKHGFGPGEWIAVSSIIASLATLIVAVVNSK
jgi:protein involved in polysaccharide export with SLBB domain